MLHARIAAALAALVLAAVPASSQVLGTDQEQRSDISAPGAQAGPAPGLAADAMPTWGSLFTALPRDLRHLPSPANLLWLGSAGAGALAVHGEDARLTRQAANAQGLEDALDAGAFIGGGLIQVGGAFGTFAVGRLTGHPRLASIGADLVRAQILSTAITQGTKVGVGRQRPDGSRFSFPSGHASSSFATATVLQRTAGWKVGLPAYAMATYVAASRLSENRHYPSDVIFGAAIGIVTGRAVTVGHGRHAFGVGPVASRGAVGLEFTRLDR